MDRLLIVSNRLPVSIKNVNGTPKVQQSVGGLATGLKSFYKKYDSIWVGWSGIEDPKLLEKKDEIKGKLIQENCHPVFLSKNDIDNFYYGFSNNTIWPLFHYFTQHTIYNKKYWESYKNVNKIFLDSLRKIMKPNDNIWIQDYHLLLLPKLIRDEFPDAKIGFFLHIPFPSYEVFRLLPWRKEIIEGLLGADLIGFHTYDYVRHFISSVRRLLGYENNFNQIITDNRIIKTDAFPMGIDYEKYAKASSEKIDKNCYKDSFINKTNKININDIKKASCKLILSVDRLDYTKGIAQRLEAYDHFLDKYPEYKNEIILVLVAVPSRTNVEEYKTLKRNIDELIGKINGKHGSINWMPIWYLYRSLPFKELISLYKFSDIALITPLRDGMNLIAKEYLATKTDGEAVLIISEMAGASKELGEAIVVNPNNKEEIAEAIKSALTMPQNEKINNTKIMQNRIKRYNVEKWAADFMDSLSEIKKVQKEHSIKLMSKVAETHIIDSYKKANKRIIFLDYDERIIASKNNPNTIGLYNLLLENIKSLSADKKNEIVIVSGMVKEKLDKWFGNLDIVLISEHGIWCKEPKGKWSILEHIQNEWKNDIRPILERYVDRTPGTFIKEKEFSIIWNYKRADPELKSIRAWELKDSFLHFISNLNLEIQEASNMIEIKYIGINKGKAANNRIIDKNMDFILAIGDNFTDEDLFTILPDHAFSIKIGIAPSQAKLNLLSIGEAIELLGKLK